MITELIFDWAGKTPEKTAVIYNERPWSYSSFAEEISLARAYFLRRGYIGPGYAVLAFRNLMDFWILSLALRSLGLTTVAVGSAAMLDALALPDVRCVITRPSEFWPGVAELCAARSLRLLSVSLEGEPALGEDAPEVLCEPGGHILLTSGTTGTFKMVLMSPAIDAVFLRRKVDVIGMSQDTLLSVFDFTAWTAIGYRWAASPWIVGGTVLIDQGREPYRALLHPAITHAVLVPARLDPILAAPTNAFARNEALELTVAGGAMTRRQVERAKARITPRVSNLLASTEAGVIAYTLLETDEDQRWHRLVADRTVEIVDDSDHPVPAGEVGGVRVSTAGGPTGYLDNEAATEIFFRNDYFYPGDLAIRRSDGRMALQGRSSDIINLGGQKIFPGPIEDHLCELLDVGAVCLLSMQNGGGEEELHVVIETAMPIENEPLSAALKSALKAYPRAHVRVRYLPSLPRNHMGKMMRQAVRAHVTASLSPSG